MMHDEYTMLMSLVLDQEATPVEAQRLKEHLLTCHVCAETWQHWRTLDRRFAAAPLQAAPLGLAERVVARLDQVELRARRLRWLSSGLLAGGLALLAFLALWGGLAFTWFQTNTTSILSWFAIAAQWISALLLLGRGAWAAVSSLGAPALAGVVGLLACISCALGMIWLLWVPRQRVIVLGGGL